MSFCLDDPSMAHTRRAAGAAVLALWCATLSGQGTAPPPLVLGAADERTLAPGAAAVYQLPLVAGHFVAITIRQSGVDLAATLAGPDGAVLMAVDALDDPFREEALAAIAAQDGVHTVTVRASGAGGGRYAIVLEAERPAGPDEATRVEAERQFVDGVRHRQTNNTADGWRASVEALDRALAHYRDLGDRRGETKALLEKGRAEYLLGRAEALDSVEAAEGFAHALGDRAVIARALALLGTIVNARGDTAGGLRLSEASVAISRELGSHFALSRGLTQVGNMLHRQGEVERALLQFEEALTLAREASDPRMEAGLLNNIGLIYKSLGEYDRALAVYEQSLVSRRVAGDLSGQFPALMNLGGLHGLKGDHPAAQALQTEGLTVARQLGSARDIAAALDNLGVTLERLGEHEQALAHHRECLDLRRRVNDAIGMASSHAGIGRTLNALGLRDEALVSLHEALALNRRIQFRGGERDVLLDLAGLERARGNLAAATAHVRAALEIDERLRAQITSPALRASFVASVQTPYEMLIALLQQQHAADPAAGYDRAAFEASERARARVLLDALLDGRVDLRRDIDPALREREDALQQQLSDASAQLSRLLATGAGPEKTKSASDRMNQVTAAYQTLEEQIRRQNPHYAAALRPQPIDADRVRQDVLDADTVLLEFALGHERSWVWAITTGGIASVELPPRAEIETRVRSLYDAVTERQRRTREPGSGRLMQAADARLEAERAAVGQMLLGGLAARLTGEWQGKRLAIVATGVLEYVPYAALSIVKGAPLAAAHEIVLLPSASVLDALRRDAAGRSAPTQGIAVIADPVFERSDPRVATAGAASAATTRTAPRAPLGTRLAEGGRLTRLPFSREEATAIGTLARPLPVFQATDFDATRTAVVGDKLAGYRVVHLATHGVFDAGNPAVSGLVFSLFDRGGQPQDGFLRLNDIYNMRLSADLVVLSACQTALGREIRGEGLVGLARGFMHAGAPRVVASLWQVSDLATAELMKRFYRGILAERLRPAAALRAAQLDLSRDPRWRSPYYWAGFTLQGDWR